ncbi:Rid family hydrolase [Acetobacter orientalis]|uniref:Rid family hydrolase n=1 Tax=Acetobacter orientalis TaxID=146474 RepID=UPI000A3D1960|nr:Rid family hydrolase [Acetobacter orientalis]
MINQTQSRHASNAQGIGRIERLPVGLKIAGLRAPNPEGQSMAEQCQAALDEGLKALQASGYSLSDVTRVVYLIADAASFPTCAPILRHVFAESEPSVTLMWVKKLAVPAAKIEFEFCVSEETNAA